MREVWADMRARSRERRFASDARAGSWVRAEAARRELQFLRERWRPFTILLIGAAALISAVSYLAPAGFVRGFAVGSMSVATAAMICVLTIEASGTTMTRMGATAEQWTAAELRPLRRSGWHLINHHTGPREIDHLLIGPAGIVVAETKWSISEWRRDGHDYRLRQALSQVTSTARMVEKWPEVEAAGCLVRPVVFMWHAGRSPQISHASEVVFVDKIAVVSGAREAAKWRGRVLAAPGHLGPDDVDALTAAALDRLADGDRAEAARSPAPPSFQRLYWTTVASVMAAIGGALVVLEPLAHQLYWLAAAAWLLGGGLGLALRRVKLMRLPADAWLAALVGVGALAAVVLALE